MKLSNASGVWEGSRVVSGSRKLKDSILLTNAGSLIASAFVYFTVSCLAERGSVCFAKKMNLMQSHGEYRVNRQWR